MEDTPFDRPTDRVRKIMPLAREHASRLGHAAVAPGHLLLAILEEGTGVAAQVVRNAGIDVEELRAAVEAASAAPGGAVGPRLPITPDLRAVLEAAVVEAQDLGHDYVGSEHLLLALVDSGDSAAGGLLIAAGLDPAGAHRKVCDFVGAAEKDDQA